MKVAIVNSFYPPWRGGAETYVSSLATALRNRGHSITVICSCDPLKPGIYNDNGIDINRLRLIGRLYGTPIPVGLRGALEEIDADILHANFPSPYFAYNVSRIARLRKIPAVLTWHNDLPGVTLSAKLLIEIHDKLVLPRYIHEYRQIIATSPIYASRSRILGQFPKRVTVIPNGVGAVRNPSFLLEGINDLQVRGTSGDVLGGIESVVEDRYGHVFEDGVGEKVADLEPHQGLAAARRRRVHLRFQTGERSVIQLK